MTPFPTEIAPICHEAMRRLAQRVSVSSDELLDVCREVLDGEQRFHPTAIDSMIRTWDGGFLRELHDGWSLRGRALLHCDSALADEVKFLEKTIACEISPRLSGALVFPHQILEDLEHEVTPRNCWLVMCVADLCGLPCGIMCRLDFPCEMCVAGRSAVSGKTVLYSLLECRIPACPRCRHRMTFPGAAPLATEAPPSPPEPAPPPTSPSTEP